MRLGKAHLSEAMKFLRSSYDEPENGEEGQDAVDDGRESVAKQTRFFFVNPQMSDSAKPALLRLCQVVGHGRAPPVRANVFQRSC